MQLRGGGCGTSKKSEQSRYEIKRGQQKVADITNEDDKNRLARLIDHHCEIIIKHAVTAVSEKQRLMVSFSFFVDNKRELWSIVVNIQQTNEFFDIIKKQLKPLLEALQMLIKSFVNYSVYVAQIISQLSWIIFSFYTAKNNDRYLDVKEQDEYLNLIAKIEEQVKIEKNIDKFLNNLEYELFIIKSIFTICPTNSDEVQEILILFVGGAAASFASFSLNPDFIQSLKRSVIFLYNEQNKASCKKKLKIIFSLLNLKFGIIQYIEDVGVQGKKQNINYFDQLSSIYKDVIEKSSDWEIWCTWIRVLSSLFQQKLILPFQKVKEYISNQPFIHKLSEEKVWVNLDSKLIEKNATAKLLFENIEHLQEQAKLQYSILHGYQDMPSFEQLFFARLSSQSEKQDYKQYQFSLAAISLMCHNSQQISKNNEKINQLINVLNVNNLKVIKDIESNLQSAISCTISLIEEISSFDEIKELLLEDLGKSNFQNLPEQPLQQIPEQQQQQQQQQQQLLQSRPHLQVQQPLEVQQSTNILNQKPKDKQTNKNEVKWFDEHLRIRRKFCQSFVSLHLKRLTIEQDITKQKIIFDLNSEFILQSTLSNSSQDSNILNSNQQLVNSPNHPQQASPSPQQIRSGNQSPNINLAQFNFIDQVNQDNLKQSRFNIISELQILQKYKKQKQKVKTPTFQNVLEIFSQTPLAMENLIKLQARLKYISINKSKFSMETDDDYKEGLRQSFTLLQYGLSFLKWNLRLYMTMQFYLSQLTIQNQNDDDEQNTIVELLKSLSSQLAECKPLTKSIKFFYGKFDACKKLKLIQEINKSNLISRIVSSTTLRKFETLNLLLQIYKVIISKTIEKNQFKITSQIFLQIENEIEQYRSHLAQLNSGFIMVRDIIKAESLQNNQGNNQLNILQQNQIFQNKFHVAQTQEQILQNKDLHQKIEDYYRDFSVSVKQLQNKKHNNDSLLEKVHKKEKTIKQVIQSLDRVSKYQILSDDDIEIANHLHSDVNNLLESVAQIEIELPEGKEYQEYQQTLVKGQSFFELIAHEMEIVEQLLQIQVSNLKFINNQSGLLSGLLTNYTMLEKISSHSQNYKDKMVKIKEQLISLLSTYQKTIPDVLIDCEKISEHQLNDLKFSKDLESQTFFILTQIGKQNEIQQDTGYYDQFKEIADDIYTSNAWRIRQFCIFELIQFKSSCLTSNSVALCTGLYIKLQIYETDKRNKLLLEDQDAENLSELVRENWPNQEDEVQMKIKAKLEELNNIAYKVTIEVGQHEKSKLKKEYLKLEQEIQAIIKNAEKLGNAIGTSLIFFQDLKQDLIAIQSQLKSLQSVVDQISKDVQYLRGRSVKDLLEMRMQRILQLRLIINSESVYIQMKTKEKNVINETEDEETPLFTEDIFSDGEINEFIWKQQKVSLLIQGKAGSGKSTAARKIEEFLWLLYQKNKDIQGSIPIIPIFVALPQLKDPLYSAMEETLRSDNYRFNDKQIIELKEAIESNELKLVIIMDSYDEIKSQFIGVNLNQTNKLFKWRTSSDELKYPKIITTSRSEIFNSGGYNSWFLSESDNLDYYKEIRLLNFSSNQVQLYIEQYCLLCVKKILKEFYFSLKDNQGFFAFQEIFVDVIRIINEHQNQHQENEHKLLLQPEQVQKIIQRCSSFVNGDVALAMQEMLEEIWSDKQYQNFISKMEIGSLLETPFMVEIVATVLPQMVKHRQEVTTLKEYFIERFKHYKKTETDLQKVALDLWQKIVNNEGFMNDFFHQFSEVQQLQVIETHFSKNPNIDAIRDCLIMEPLCAYDFYIQFFEQYFKRQISKLKETGEAIDYQTIGSELWEFAHRLANDMTVQNLSQVKYKPSGLIFKKKEIDWKDIYFNDDCDTGVFKKMFRTIMPIKQKFGIYSFNHKSLQEFLVSKWFIESLKEYESDIESYLSKNLNIFEESFYTISWDQDFMKGSVRFIVDKLKCNKLLIEKLQQILYLSKSKTFFMKLNHNLRGKQQLQITESSDNFANEKQGQQQLERKEDDYEQSLNKIDEKICRGSSNSLYLLYLMGFSFIRKDFTSLRIRDINLSGANFFGSSLQNSKFSNVKISKTNFNSANLSNTNWNQIFIDELPHIQTKLKISFIAYLKELNALLVRGRNKYKNIEETKLFDISSVNEMQKDTLVFPFQPTLLIQSNLSTVTILVKEDTELAVLQQETQQFLIKKLIYPVGPQQQQTNFKFGAFSANDDFLFLCKGNELYQISTISLEERNEDLKLEKKQLFQYETQIKGMKLTDRVYLLFNSVIIELYEGNLFPSLPQQESLFYQQQAQISYFDINQGSTLLAVAGRQLAIQNSQQIIDEQEDIKLFSLKELEKPLFIFQVSKEHFSFLQFVEEDKYLISVSNSLQSSKETYLRLWHVREHILVQQIVIREKVVSLALIPNLSLVAAALQNDIVQIWDVNSSFSQNLTKTSANITSCIFSLDGTQLISGNSKGIIQVWNCIKGIQIGKDLNSHSKNVTSLVIIQDKQHNDEELLGSASIDGFVHIWNLKQQKLQQSIFVIDPIEKLDIFYYEDQYYPVTLSRSNNYLQIWSNNNGYHQYILICDQQNKDIPNCISLTKTKEVVFLCQEEDFELMNNPVYNLNQEYGQQITFLLISDYYEWLFIGTNIGDIVILNEKAMSKELHRKNYFNEKITLIKEINKNKFIAVSQRQFKIFSYGRSNKFDFEEKVIDSTLNQITQVLVEGETMFVCDQEIRQVNINTGQTIKKVLEGYNDAILSLYFQKDKNKLYTGDIGGQLITIDMLTNHQIYYNSAHDSSITGMKFLHSQNKLLTTSKSGQMKIWSINSSEENMKQPEIIQVKFSINELWISALEDYIVINTGDTIQIRLFLEEDSYQVHSFNNSIHAYHSISLSLKQQYIYYTEDDKIFKQQILQQKLKEDYLTNSHYKPEIMNIGKSAIITADNKGDIVFWDFFGKQLSKPKNLADDMQKFTLQISPDKNRLVLFYLNNDYFLQIYTIQGIELEGNVPIEVDFKNIELIINNASFLDENHLLLTLQSNTMETAIFSLLENSIIQGFHDHEGLLEGSAVDIVNNCFVTYGECNQISYYERINEKFSEKFVLSNTMKKFGIKDANIENSQIISKYGIDLQKLFQQKNESIYK